MSTTTKTEDPKTQTTESGNGKPQAPVYTAEHPEYPKMMYNAKNRTVVAAKDKDSEDKLKGKGYGEDPYPPLPPDAMTPQDTQELDTLVHKQLAELSKSPQTPPVPPPVPGAEPYPGATGATDSSSSSSNHPAAGAAGKPPAR